MKEFMSDYYHMVLVPAWMWAKKHWVGLIAFCVISYSIGFFVTWMYLHN